MRLSDSMCDACILDDLASETRDEVLGELAAATAHAGVRPDDALRVLRDRERLGSTAVGMGVAIPHGKMPGLDHALLVFGRSRRGIACGAPDDKPCSLFFMVLAPEGAAGQQLAMLGSIARLARDETFRNSLMQAKSLDELRALFAAV
jgi:PTS system nitrogen regulatory IIA component